MNKRSVILLGGGYSIKEGINLGLWNKIKDKEVWSINYAFMTMPFLPKVETWVDISFFSRNIDKLQDLYKKGVKCYSKSHTKYVNIPEITKFDTTRNLQEAVLKNKVYIGQMGLSGFFALYIATFKEYFDNIYILGFDFGSINNDSRTHFYQGDIQIESCGIGHPELYRNKEAVREEIKDFEIFRSPSVKSKIYNVSPKSAIECFEKITYEQFFKLIENES